MYRSATKFDPHHLQSFTVILRSLRPEVQILFRLEMRCMVCSLLPRIVIFTLVTMSVWGDWDLADHRR